MTEFGPFLEHSIQAECFFLEGRKYKLVEKLYMININ